MASQAAAPVAPAPVPEYIAVVTSKKSMVIQAQVEGPIKQLYAEQSKAVKQGEVIAEIDTTQLESKLAEQEANKLAALGDAGGAGAHCSEARQKAVSAERLGRKGVYAPAQVREMQAEASAACAQAGGGAGRAKAADVEITRIKKLIGLAKVVAPMDGVITNVKQKIGAQQQIGQPIAQVLDPNDLLVRFAVPRTQRTLFAQGTQIRFEANDSTDRPHYATVSFIRDEVDPKIDFAIVDAELDEKIHRDLNVGVRGHVRIAKANNAPVGGTL